MITNFRLFHANSLRYGGQPSRNTVLIIPRCGGRLFSGRGIGRTTMSLFSKWCQPQPVGSSAPTFDDESHTPNHPYCSNLACWCHTSAPYHDEVISTHYGSTTTQEERDDILDAAWTLFHNSGS
jgi:hypothetical protein